MSFGYGQDSNRRTWTIRPIWTARAAAVAAVTHLGSVLVVLLGRHQVGCFVLCPLSGHRRGWRIVSPRASELAPSIPLTG